MATESSQAADWAEAVEVLVVGSGAAGMTAALTAALRGSSVMVVESTGYFGGTTAYSGGAVWIPCNPVMERAGIRDSVQDARTYLEGLSGDSVPDTCREAYLREGPAMVRELEARTRWVRWRLLDYPDYYCDSAGGVAGGRSIEAQILDGRALGPDLEWLRPVSGAMDMGPATITAMDFAAINMVSRTWRGRAAAARIVGRTLGSIVRRQKLLGIGQALCGRLRLALRDAGVPVRLRTRLTELLVEDGRVIGAALTGNGGAFEVRARHGVVLAAGGFSRNVEMRNRHLPKPTDPLWSMVPPEGQDGDAILAGLGVGARTALMNRAWGMPTLMVSMRGGAEPLLSQVERALPGALVVGDDGRRYADETLPYEDFWKAMYESGGGSSWLVFDQRVKNRYIVLRTPPRVPFPRRWLREKFVLRARDLGALARRMGVPAEAFAETVAHFNRAAAEGRDGEFGRGESTYARFFGDPTLPSPNLGPLTRPPFYAVRLHPGELSTKGGLVVDEHARVLGATGPIPGLYAAGNTAAAPGVGDSYPGAGGTLGPAMVFGYIAGCHAAGEKRCGTAS